MDADAGNAIVTERSEIGETALRLRHTTQKGCALPA